MKKSRLTASYMCQGEPHVFTVYGQTAKALKALVTAQQKGITAMEVAGWAYRLAAYCHTLRTDHGVQIQTLKEKHDGGWHARYVLRTNITIIDTAPELKAA